MRKNFLKSTKAYVSIFLCISIVLTLFMGDSSFAYISEFGTTSIIYSEELEIAKGVVLNNWRGKGADGSNKIGHTITFNPATSDAMVVAAYGNSVNSRVTLSSTSYLEEQNGVSIIGGINGDFYHLANGIPIGLVIRDGRLVSNSSTKWNAIGFKEDGSVVIGSPDIEMKAVINNTEYPFVNFNKAQGDWGPYLYSSDYGPNTGSTVPSIEIIMDIDIGEPAPGKLMVATVSEIRNDTKATPIGKNQLVFSARIGKTGHYALSQFKKGDKVTILMHDKTGEWNDVKHAIGGDTILINNGVIASGLSKTNYDPSTAVGVKANGEVVFFQADGRTSASKGVSSMEIAQFLLSLGCVKAIKLDGGGSSAIITRMPGYKSPGLINKPSDGNERANSNALLLVSKQSINLKNGTYQVSPRAEKLHVYPVKTFALPNSSVQYSALATDNYYFPTELPAKLNWASNAGQMDSSGNLTVNAAPGTYQVQVTGGSAHGWAEVIVPASVTSIKPSKSIISLLPGASVDLSCEAYYYDMKVIASDRSFTWQVEGNIGTITQDGVFTMAPGVQGKGRIAIKYGSTTAYVDVVSAESPDSIEDFENGLQWGSSTVKAKSGSVKVINDPNLARSGSNLLRLDYDFTLGNGVESGIAGVYAFRLDPNTKAQTGITLEKNPTAIGMWIYGDNSKTWIRAKVKDGSGQYFDIDFTPEYRTSTNTGGVDWTGWKYVEAQIPSNRKGPFTLDTPIRVMCTRDELRTKGTLYFDGIRAIYGVSSKDSTPPSASLTAPTPNSTLNSSKVPFTIQINDAGSGVDPKSVTVHLNGAQVPNLSITGSGNLTVKGEVGTSHPIPDGYQRLVVSYADVMGNRGTSTFSFNIDTGSPQIVAVTSPSLYAGSNMTTTISVKNPKNLKKVYLDFKYDPKLVEVVDADPNTPGKQIALDGWAKKGKVLTNNVDEANGRIIIQIDNLANLSQQAQSTLGNITFKGRDIKTKATTSVDLHFGAILVSNIPQSQWISLPSMSVDIDYSLTLSVTGTAKGELTRFTVTDKGGNPIEGAGLYFNNLADPIWYTDKNGRVETYDITKFPVGISFDVKAKKGDFESDTITLTIGEQASGLEPKNLSLSLGSTPGSISLNFITPREQTGTIVQFMEKNKYSGSFTNANTVKGSDKETALINLDKTEAVREHTATLTNLNPGTEYVYRVGDSAGRYSSVFEFTSPDYQKPYSFFFVTDPQAVDEASYKIFGDVLNRAVEKARNPSFGLMAGDLVDRGGNRKQWDMMFNSASHIFSRIPVMTTPGNHEYYDDSNLVNFKAFFTLPENGPEGCKETAYSFETENALFIVLDTQQSLTKQMQWLENICKASNKKWKIVMMHRGIYSGFYNEEGYRKIAGPVFDRAGIDLVLNGHDHTYLRTTMKAGNKVAPGEGTTYITGGSSAKKYYDAEPRAWTDVLYDTNNPVFTTFTVYDDRISVVSSHIEGGKTVEHDVFDIVKR